jgi:hypothetical protein
MADFFASPKESVTPFVHGFNNSGRKKANTHGVSQHGGEDKVDQQEKPTDVERTSTPPRKAHVASG